MRTRSIGNAVFCVAMTLALVPAVARAETLAEGWQAALASDLALEAAVLRLDAADAALAAASAERRPTLAATSTAMRFDTTLAFAFPGLPALPLFGGQSMVMSDVRVSVPVFTAGRIGAQLDAATAQRDVVRSASDTLALDIKLGVAEAYVGVLRAESALTVASANVAGLAAHARDVDDMFRSGQVPRNDQLAASVALADATQQELRAKTQLEVARAAYNRSVGRALASPVELDPALPAQDPDLAGRSLAALTELATGNRDELAGLQSAAEGLQAQADATRATTRPQLMANGGYTFVDNDFLNRDDFWSVGLSFQWNLFDGGRSRNSRAALSQQAEALDRDRANLATLIELAVHEAWLAVAETRQRIDVTIGAVAQAEENLRVVRNRYRNGEGTNTEVLDAETLWQQSQSNYDAARYDAAIAEFRLARAIGQL